MSEEQNADVYHLRKTGGLPGTMDRMVVLLFGAEKVEDTMMNDLEQKSRDDAENV